MVERVGANAAGDTDELAQIERRALERNAKHTDWICDERRMGLTAGGDALYMHCLPADIGAEVSPGVMAAAQGERRPRGELEDVRGDGADRRGEGPRRRGACSPRSNRRQTDDRVGRERHQRPATRRPRRAGGELSELYLPLARDILRECIRIPADYVDRPVDEGGDPACGLSNHEGPRLEFLKQTIIDIGAVRHPDDVWFDDYGNLVWTVSDPEDGIYPDRQAGRLLRWPHRHRAGAALVVAGEAGRDRRLRRDGRRRRSRPRLPALRARPSAARRRVGQPDLRARVGRPAQRRRLAGRGHQDRARARPRGRAARRDHPGVRHRLRGGQRRRGADVPDEGGAAGRAARPRPRRRHPHRGHRRRAQGRARDLPRTARAGCRSRSP